MSEPETRKQKPGRAGLAGLPWLRILLFASLAANLLIIGMVTGAALRGGPASKGRPADNPPLYDLGYGPYGRALSPDDRRKIGRAMDARAPDLRANREDFRVRALSLLEALRQVPYEPERVREIVSLQQNRLLERQDIGKKLLLDLVEGMNDGERREYADRLERSLRRGDRSDRRN